MTKTGTRSDEERRAKQDRRKVHITIDPDRREGDDRRDGDERRNGK